MPLWGLKTLLSHNPIVYTDSIPENEGSNYLINLRIGQNGKKKKKKEKNTVLNP